jgi:hypothetical protein
MEGVVYRDPLDYQNTFYTNNFSKIITEIFLEINIHSKILKSDLVLLKNNLDKYFNLEKYEPKITTVKIIS